MLFLGILAGLAGAGALFGLTFWLKKQTSSSGGDELKQLVKDVEAETTRIEELLQYRDSYLSKGQYDFVVGRLDEVKIELQNEKDALQGVETKLDGAQKAVEERESKQQDLKTAKEEDELKIQALMSSYDDVSKEAITLEQSLAASMKNLDSMMDTLELTAPQKAVLQELSNALTEAGSRMRDLITEYEQINERLKGLELQHRDLEEEYTKLVEKQLGD